MSQALKSFINLNVQIARQQTNKVDVTTQVVKLVYFTFSIYLIVLRFRELEFCLLFLWVCNLVVQIEGRTYAEGV